MTRTHGLLKSLLFVCLAAFPLVAHGATTTSEFRVLFDSEAGGCIVAGMPGVDQVLNTRVEIDDVANHAHVVSTSWQECQGALLGPATPIAHSPYDVGYDAATGKLLIETAIPFSAFDPTKMRKMRIGVDAHIGDLAHTALTLPDESFVYFPAPSIGRRRAVAAPGEERVIVLNGNNADWKGLKPKFEGIGGSGSPGLRILNVFAFGDTHTNQLFFLFDVSISLNVPFARNDSYARPVGENLTVPGPSNAPGVLDNDDGLPLLPLKAKLVAQPPAGTVALNETGGFTYTPNNPNATADDTFKYKAFHTVLGVDIESNTADVTIVTEDVDDSNQAPSFTVGPDIFVDEDSGPQVITNWATGISAGAGEGDQTVAFVITNNSNPGLFANPPTVSATGVLSFEAAADASGSATITIKLTDNGGTANLGDNESDPQTFNIHVDAVNDEPSFSPGPHIVVEDNDGPQSTPWATSISAGPADESGQTLTFIVSNNNPSLFTVQPSISSTGVLTFTPAVGVDGIATVTVELQDDDGTANGGVDTSSPPYQLQITVERAPLITSADNTTFIAGQGNTFLVTTTGRPRPSITQGGTLPAGVTFVNGTGPNQGTGTLSGTPGLLTGGVYPLTFFATNTRGTSPTQNFTLTVNQAPAITSGNTATFTRNAAGSFTITTTAYPTASISLTGTLPIGLSFVDNANGTATISGTPTAAGGSFGGFTVTASNGVGANANQSLTIIVNEAPAITSANSTGFNATIAATFTVTTTGFPAPALSFTGTLPNGINFNDNGNGTASLGGTAVQGSGGVYSITITATNVAGSAPQTFTITVCNQIAVTNPGTTTGTVGTAFSQTFTQTGAVGAATFTTASTLPAGLTLATNGTLSGTPTQFGSFPIVVTVTDVNGCTGTGATYTLVISCQTITVNNPANANGTAGSAFSETFTQTGALGGATFTLATGTLPTGLTLSTAGVLSGTPTQTGSFPITVLVTDGNGCTGTSATYTLVIGCQTITVTNPGTNTGTANAAFSQTFTQTNAIGGVTFTTSSTLPAGLTLATNGTLSGTPTQTGVFPIVVTVTDSNGCTGTGATYTLTIGCQTITVTNPATTTGTANAAFSQTFTQSGAIGTATFTTASTLPAGLTLATNGVLSGTPTQTGSFPIVVTVTDVNGCTGTGATYTLVIGCQTITVTNPANPNGTVSAPFSETFTQTGSIGSSTFTTASTLPAGLTLSTAGVLSGTPTQSGSFPIVVTVTDSNGCTGTSATYNLVISCQTITVTNPATATGPAGTPFSQTFTQTGAIGGATFTTASTLPTGLTLSSAGVLSGTPNQGGTFPIVVTVTDGNGCTGTSATYNLVITCPVITVTNPANANGTANAAFSETFTQTGAIGGATFTLATGTLPTGLTLSTAGVLSGTPTQTGSFPITVLVTDGNGCTGTSATYTIVIACQTITVNNPGVTTGTANAAFSQTFTQSGAIGGTTFTLATGTLPTGVTLATNGVLSGTPTQTGSFPITVLVTDSNGCTGTSTTYTLVISCQTITVNNPANANGTILVPFSETFTQTGAIGSTTFTTASTLPAGLSLATNGVLSGTPTQTGSFPIVVTVTDSNGCTGTSATYTLVIACQTITVTNPVVTGGTVNAAFSQTFTQTGANGGATFTLNSGTLPTGLSLAANGVLSGLPTQTGSFPITVLVTDGNGCTGVSATYTLVIACQTITVNNPGVTTGTASSPFSQTFTQTGAFGSTTFTTSSTLPTGLSLSTAGVLSGTPTQTGSFPIVVTVTDSNGCTGTSATYTLVIGCQTINVTNPGVTTGTVDAAFSQSFGQTGAIGSTTFTLATGTLPPGLTLSSAGVLSGAPGAPGSYPITVTVTDSNGCTGTSATYTLIIGCQTITVTNPINANGTGGVPFSETFTQTGVGTHTPATFTLGSGTLPNGLTLSTAGVLSGTPTQFGTFPITVTVTDANGCSGTGPTYNLVIVCPTFVFVPANTMPAATYGVAYSQNISVSGGNGPYTLSLANATNVPTSFTFTNNGNGTATIASANPTVTGVFTFDVNVLDTSSNCTQTQTFSFTVIPNVASDTYSAANGLTDSVGNTQAVAFGFSTPTTPYVNYAPSVLANDSAPAATLTVVTPSVTNAAGTITFNAAGGWSYIPALNFTGTATFNYIVASNGAQAPASVSIVVANKVWYVTNNSAAGGTGLSNSPFDTLPEAQTASAIGDIIYVSTGDGTTLNQNTGITLKNNQQLIGNGSALVVNTNTLAAAGTKPLIGNTTAAAVTLANGNTLRGFTATTTVGATLAGISGNALTTGATINNVNVTTTTGAGINLTASGTITTSLTDVVITGAAIGINANTFGTLTINSGVSVSGTQALALNTGAVNGTFVSVNATGGTMGVACITCTGTVVFAGGTLTGASGIEFLIDGGSINVTYQGNITYGGSGNAIYLTATAGTYTGNATFDTGTINVTGGTGIFSSSASGTYAFNGPTTINGAAVGVLLSTNANGTYGFGSGFGITNTTGTAFATTNNSAKITYSGNITQGTSQLMVRVTSLSNTGNATFQTGTLSATNGAGILLEDVDGPVSFNGTTTLNGGDAAIDVTAGTDAVNGSQGTIVFASGSSITNPSGAIIDIQGSATNFTYGGTYSKSSAATAFNFANNKAALVVSISNAAAKTLGTTTADAIVASGNAAGGSITFGGGNLAITTTTGRAVNATGAGTLQFTGGNNDITSANTALLINGLSLGTSSFDNITTTGGTSGISLTATTGSATIAAGTLSGATNATFLVSGGSVSVTDGGSIGQGTAAQPVVSVAGGHTGALTFNGAVSATGGTGLQFDNADGAYNFNNASSSFAGGDAGVDILNGSGGTFGFVSGIAITNPSGTAFNVSASAPTSISYAGSITANNARAVAISNAAAAGCGSQSYSGSITASGASATGIQVNNCNAGTIAFSGSTLTLSTVGNNALTFTGNAGATVNVSGGNLSLTTTNGHGINATGGGTISITGNDNTINTTGSGSAINWAMTAGVHSAGTLRFETINKSGSGTDGVVVNYHDGSFTVTGDDDNNGSPDSATSGGTITGTAARGMEFLDVDGGVTLAGMTFTNATTTDGTTAADCGNAFMTAGNKNCNAPVYFDTVANVSMNTVDINGSTQVGLVGYDVNGLTLNTVTVRNGGTTIDENGGAAFRNLTGTVSVTNSSFRDNTRAQLDITNLAGSTAGNMTFYNNEFTGNRAPNLSAQGFLMINGGTMGTISIGDGTVANDNNFHDSFSNGFQYSGQPGNTSATININRNSFTNVNSGVVLQVAGVGAASSLTYTINNNNLQAGALMGSGAIITSATQGHVLNGTIQGNTIGTSGVANSGAVCNSCNGITVDHDGFGRHNVSILDNVVQRVKSIGIYYQVADASGNVVITGNTVREPEGNPSSGIYVQSGTLAADNGCVALTLGGTTAALMNNVQGSWDPAGFQSEIFVWRRFATTMNLPGLSGGEIAWIAARNTIPDATGADITVSGTPFGNLASCP